MADLPNFPTCHSHPASFDSGSTPDAMAKREVELGTGTLTMTDHGTLAAARQVYRLAKKHKLTPVLGLEGYFRDDDCELLAKYGITKQVPLNRKGEPLEISPGVLAAPTVAHYLKYLHITMHTLDQTAWEAMVRLLSQVDKTAEQHGQERKPLFAWRHLEELGQYNITFGSGCLVGMVQRHLLAGQPKLALEYYQRFRSLVKPGNFFVEMMPHRCDKNWDRACYVTFGQSENGILEDERRFHTGKWLRITWDGGTEEVRVMALAERFQKAVEGGKKLPTVKLLAVKNWQTWADEAEPLPITSVRLVEDFIPNECQPWCPDGDVQLGANRFMLMMARRFGDPILVSDDSHFARPEERDAQDVRLLSMENDKTKGNVGNWRFYGSYHRRTSAEVAAYFKERLGIEEAQVREWVENSRAWSKRFGWKFEDRKSLPTKFYPTDTLKHTLGLIQKVGRMNWRDPVMKERLTSEIDMLYKNGSTDLLPYFFLDQEVVQLYEDNGLITGPGRGSAAGLLLAYLLGITHVNPLRYDLSKERFLTKSRIQSGKWPDIDQDLPHRDLLVNPTDPTKGWLAERFPEHYAQVSTDMLLRLRSTIQDVHRVKDGRVDPTIFQLTQKMQKPPQGIKDKDFIFGYKDADGEPVQGSIETDEALKEYVRRYPEHWKLVVKCLGLVRGKSRHACAYVVANEPITNFLPTMNIGGVECTAYVNSSDDPAVEDSGGLKMDFLIVNSLKDIQGAIKLIQQAVGYQPKDETIKGVRVPGLRVVPVPREGGFDLYDVWDLPEDQDVFADICRGDTPTVFQFNTPSARQWLQKFYKDGEHTLRSIEHISAFTALDRPGPLNASVEDTTGVKRNMLEEFAARSKGEKPIGNLPVLDKLFPETFGVITYQEQLQKTFVVVGKTTAEQGDDFRVHVSKKKMELVLKDKAIFMPGAIETLGEAEAERLWGMLETFGQYGFNKSHSVCYALIGFVCAWLKRRFPLQWWCAVLQNADRNEIDQKFWVHCGHLIRVPDVKMSQDDFAIEGDAIRAPLRLLNGVGDKAHAELVEGRPYRDIDDFCQKLYDRKVRTGVKTVAKKKQKVKKKDQVPGGPTEVEVEVPKLKLGRSALNNTILMKLIVSGTADSLFPPETSVYDKLVMFTEAWARANKKVKRDGSLKLDPIDDRFVDLTPIQRFLLKKSILPSYAEDLAELVYNTDRSDFRRSRTQQNVYSWMMPREFEGNEWAPVLPGDIAKRVLEQGGNGLTPKFKFGVVAFVSKVEWFWQNKAARISYEVGGERLTSVAWPRRSKDKDGNPVQTPWKLPADLAGSVVILTLMRWREDKGFSLDDIEVIEKPFSLKAKEESAEASAE